MQTTPQDPEPIPFEASCGNVYVDLGLADADALQARARMGYQVYQLLKDGAWEQRQIGALLDIKQTEVSYLMNGHFSRFTLKRLLGFLNRLDQKAKTHTQQKPGTQA